jgi:hypothetical protein
VLADGVKKAGWRKREKIEKPKGALAFASLSFGFLRIFV